MSFYVYEPGKSKPKSQSHPEHYYGPFETLKHAQDWRKEKGITHLEIYQFVKCPDCNGKGYKSEGWQPTCGHCVGTGIIKLLIKENEK